MSRKGNCWDNAPMESFFKTLKVEWVNRLRYATRAQARLDLIDWIEGFYNAQRLHSSIDYRSPPRSRMHCARHELLYVKSRQGQRSSTAACPAYRPRPC